MRRVCIILSLEPSHSVDLCFPTALVVMEGHRLQVLDALDRTSLFDEVDSPRGLALTGEDLGNVTHCF